MKLVTAFCFGILFLIPVQVLLAQAPSITRTLPGAITPGGSIDVTLSGANLASPTGLWTSFRSSFQLTPGIDKNGTLANQAVYRLTIPADSQVGIGAIRIATAKGISSLKLFMIDDLPSVSDMGDNHSPDKAQSLTLPVAVDGTCEATQTDFYKIHVTARERISIDVVAQRLATALDPVVRLLDTAGHTLAFCDDAPGVGGDSRLSHTFKAEGDYIISLRDIRHAGGATHGYRLRLGDFPLVTTAFPLGGQSGTTATFSAVGSVAEAVTTTKVTMPHTGSPVAGNPVTGDVGIGDVSFLPISLKYSHGSGSGFATVVAGTTAETIEVEPNDKPGTATKITLPNAVNGRLDQRRDRDYYEFQAKKGQRFLFVGRTRSLGSPTDLFMRLLKADGGRLAEAEDAGTNEGQLNFTFPADGTYRLMVEDLNRGGGPQHAYRVEIRPYKPGFSLSIEAEKFDIPTQGTFVTKVTCKRRDYKGSIELQLDGAIAGCRLEGHIIAAGKNDTQFKVTLPVGPTAGQFRSFRIIGKAKIGEADVTAIATTLPGLRKLLAVTPYPPKSLEGHIGLGVGPIYPDFFAISVDGNKASFPRLVGTSAFKVKIKRIDGKFKAAIAVKIEGLPDGITAEVKPVGKGEAEYNVALKGPETIALAAHKIRIVGVGTHNNQTKTVVLADLPLSIVEPVSVMLSPVGAITPGGKQKLKATVTRLGGEKTPLVLTWEKRPAGITSPDTVTIAADKNDIEIELTAAADAPLGKFAELIVIASTKIKGQDVTVKSPAATLEIKK